MIAVLSPLRTRYDYALFPVVGLLTDETFQPKNNAEVDHSFWLPLSRFLSTEGHAVKGVRIKNIDYKTHCFLDDIPQGLESVITFGITSFICVVTAMIFYRRKPDFIFPAQLEYNLDQTSRERMSWRDIVVVLLEQGSRSLSRLPTHQKTSKI